jgi:hypothetical protein
MTQNNRVSKGLELCGELKGRPKCSGIKITIGHLEEDVQSLYLDDLKSDERLSMVPQGPSSRMERARPAVRYRMRDMAPGGERGKDDLAPFLLGHRLSSPRVDDLKEEVCFMKMTSWQRQKDLSSLKKKDYNERDILIRQIAGISLSSEIGIVELCLNALTVKVIV